MAKNRDPIAPERGETARQALLAALRHGAKTARELSSEVSLREREVIEHLAHLERSLHASDERLIVEPARCVQCGFEFTKRQRLHRPSRCPRCKSERISLPRFQVAMR